MNIEDLLPEDFKQDEQGYWKVRNQLLPIYEGKWIAFHNHQVIAHSDNLYAATRAALQKSRSGAYITKVGEEDKFPLRTIRKIGRDGILPHNKIQGLIFEAI